MIFHCFPVNFRLKLPYFPTSMSVEWGDFPAATFDARHRKSRWHHTRPVWRTQNDLNLTWADEIGECMLLFLISSFKASFIFYWCFTFFLMVLDRHMKASDPSSEMHALPTYPQKRAGHSTFWRVLTKCICHGLK